MAGLGGALELEEGGALWDWGVGCCVRSGLVGRHGPAGFLHSSYAFVYTIAQTPGGYRKSNYNVQYDT